MLIFLDTDVLIDILRVYLPAINWLTQLDENETIYVPAYVVMEVLSGCRSKQEAAQARRLLQRFNICWASEFLCHEALENYSDWKLQYNIGIIDTLIAATVLSYSGILHTFNQKHYQAIKALQTHQPYCK